MGDLLVQDCGEDGETGHTEDTEEDELALSGQLGSSDHGQRDQDEAEVRADVEDHLNDRVIVVGSALEVLDGHGPILVERAAKDTVVNDLDYNEPNPYVPKESPHCDFEAGKVTAEGVRYFRLEGERSRTYKRRIKKTQMHSLTPQVEAIIDCSRAMTILEPRMRFWTSEGLARIAASCSGG